MVTKYTYTEHEENFMRENYSRIGAVGCARELRIPYLKVVAWARKGNVRFDIENRFVISDDELIETFSKTPMTLRESSARFGYTERGMKGRIYKLVNAGKLQKRKQIGRGDMRIVTYGIWPVAKTEEWWRR